MDPQVLQMCIRFSADLDIRKKIKQKSLVNNNVK